MPFDNFYEESDKSRRRWWKCFGLAFLLFIGYWAFALFSLSYGARQNVAPLFPVPAKERKERVHALCASLPVPEDFQFAGKSNTTDAAAFSSVDYLYKSSRSKDEIFPTFIVWFGENGWNVQKSSETSIKFRKNNQSVEIAPFAVKPLDYFMVTCTEGKYD
jgi:hypothetical protein